VRYSYGGRKASIIAAHQAHPDWNTRQIANHLSCLPSLVRSVKHRYQLKVATVGVFRKYEQGPARAAVGTFPYPGRTVEQVDKGGWS